ncbi:hypothetical protein [Thiocystis violascens]|uniref:Uncharacterized protein n=1 Tax=Thiocystis violascens (strain ATCC 17096 / DSM 198 / 6111) TaxID=765911 RepID=I3Y8P4_THIV6|nr:hypothetical protein [Thiocystis violascens]AFL73362.1 hypothetical protein Thivi_1350 [Thiocystis violascens DSM 198]AFL76248.1 hypothetical protein Thivi_4447 [Thiocystis violascens DSM 198]
MSSYPLHTLRALLRTSSARRGVVVRCSATAVQVATASGLVRAQASGALSVGQSVNVRDGAAFPAANPTQAYAV